VVNEIIISSRITGIGIELQQFLSGHPLLCLDSKQSAKTRVFKLFSTIKDKIPFRCKSCNRVLWVDFTRISEKTIAGKCPSCTNVLHMRYPEGFEPHPGGPPLKQVDSIDLDAIPSPVVSDPSPAQSAMPEKDVALPASPPPESPALPGNLPPSAESGESLDLNDKFFDDISPQAQHTESAETFEPGSASVSDDYTSPMPDMNSEQSSFEASLGDAELGLSDTFFEDLIPETLPPMEDKEVQIEKDVEKSAPEFQSGSSEVQHEEQSSSDSESSFSFMGRECHVCGQKVSEEKICPSCLTELPPPSSVNEIELSDTGSNIEIRLKEEASADVNPDEIAEIDPELAQEIASELSGGLSSDMPYWQQPIWQIKVEDQIYENLDFQTIEEWIMERSVVEKDLIRKGTGKWSEIGSVPYFRNSFSIITETIQKGQADALSSFSPAPHLYRLLSTFIDIIICFILFWIGTFIYAAPILFSQTFTIFDILLFFIGPHILFPFLYMSIFNGILGRSLGKMIFKLAVINQERKPIGLLRGMARSIFAFGFFISLFTAKRQSLGDLMVGSYVIQTD